MRTTCSRPPVRPVRLPCATAHHPPPTTLRYPPPSIRPPAREPIKGVTVQIDVHHQTSLVESPRSLVENPRLRFAPVPSGGPAPLGGHQPPLTQSPAKQLAPSSSSSASASTSASASAPVKQVNLFSQLSEDDGHDLADAQRVCSHNMGTYGTRADTSEIGQFGTTNLARLINQYDPQRAGDVPPGPGNGVIAPHAAYSDYARRNMPESAGPGAAFGSGGGGGKGKGRPSSRGGHERVPGVPYRFQPGSNVGRGPKQPHGGMGGIVHPDGNGNGPAAAGMGGGQHPHSMPRTPPRHPGAHAHAQNPFGSKHRGGGGGGATAANHTATNNPFSRPGYGLEGTEALAFPGTPGTAQPPSRSQQQLAQDSASGPQEARSMLMNGGSKPQHGRVSVKTKNFAPSFGNLVVAR